MVSNNETALLLKMLIIREDNNERNHEIIN